MRTPLYQLTHDRVAEEQRALAELIQAWRFMEIAGLSITDYYGKKIQYRNIRFEGSPRDVYWSGFWEPFIYGAARKVLEWTIQTCRTRNLPGVPYLLEAKDLLRNLVSKTYQDIATTDVLLRSAGNRESAQRKDVTERIRIMNERIDALLAAVTHTGETPPPPPEPTPDILVLKPTLWGVGIDLKALWRRWRRNAFYRD